MRVHWTLSSLPELRGLRPQERRYYWRLGWGRAMRERGTILCLLGCGLLAGLGGLLGHTRLGAAAGAGIGGIVGGSVFVEFLASRVRPHLRRILQDDQRAGRQPGA